MKKVVVGISGASGAILGIRLLEAIKGLVEIHLILTERSIDIIKLETEYDLNTVQSMANFVYNNHDFCAPVASGSFVFDSMVIIPCSIKSLSAVAMSYTDSLLIRAADVTMKEKRRLILCVREMPFHEGHLQMMADLAGRGVVICPPVPVFYNHPKSVSDIVDSFAGKVMDLLGIENDIYKRWTGVDCQI
jgi:4-hydroxy-3-polyprenylbenzoate decarboxylase